MEDESLLVQTGSAQLRLDRIQWEDEEEIDAGELAQELMGAASISSTEKKR